MSHHQQSLFPDDQDGDDQVGGGNLTPWRRGWTLTEEEVAFFRERSVTSALAKRKAMNGVGRKPLHPINTPRLDPAVLMPRRPSNSFRSLSLFSGGGGLDLGFDLAGFQHVASYDILELAEQTLLRNRPHWRVHAGENAGDVCSQDWTRYRGKVDIVHGGPPCQPFSAAGRQLGKADTRDMFPQFVRTVLECQPKAFVAENVSALNTTKFRSYLEETVLCPLSARYHLDRFELKAEWFGVPQIRTRLFIVGFRSREAYKRFRRPEPTHALGDRSAETSGNDLFSSVRPAGLARTMGVREALGLPDIGFDDLAPTLRSGFTGPRGTTSVLSSVSALKSWGKLQIWPNGVARNREAAHLFVPENEHFRLSVYDAALIQGFPQSWEFCGAVYSILGQIGNSVAPPVAYRVACAVADAIAPHG